MIMIRPTKEEVESYVGIEFIASDEWEQDHREYVLLTFLPRLKPPKHVWRIVAEAYLTKFKLSDGTIRTFEQILCDGSTVVPDLSHNWGEIKDPWAMGHDLIFMLHRLNLCDIYGKIWNLKEANAMYRDGWYSQKLYFIGAIWWLGLCAFSWFLWKRPFNDKPEPITSII